MPGSGGSRPGWHPGSLLGAAYPLGEPPLPGCSRCLHRGRSPRRAAAGDISKGELDGLYEHARAAGVVGGTVAGTGGGFLLVCRLPGEQEHPRGALADFVELPFHLAQQRTRVPLNAQR